MSRFTFRDVHGRTGQISAGLDVDYRGQWEREVRTTVERIADERPTHEVDDHIVLELPEAAPIDDVERVD